MDWPSDQMKVNGLLRNRQSLMQQNHFSRFHFIDHGRFPISLKAWSRALQSKLRRDTDHQFANEQLACDSEHSASE